MIQFHRLRFIPAVFLLLTCITPYVSAFTVSSINVNPSGDQAAGTPLTVNVVINFSSKGTETFPKASELQMSTNLVDAHWVPVLVLDGAETRLEEESGTSLTLPGWYLSYPSGQRTELIVSLTGNIPSNPSGQNLLKIQEADSSNRVVTTAHVEMPATPVTTRATPTKKPTTKKIFTPIPTDTPTQESPIGTGAGIIAIIGAARCVMKRK